MQTLRSAAMLAFLILSVWPAEAGIPDFKLPDLNGKRTSYSELKGTNLTILDFWATWCKPCQRSIPAMVELYDRYQPEGVEIIGINIDSPRNLPKVRPVSASLGINYPVLLDSNSELMGKLHVTVVPTLLILDTNDEIIYRHQGYRPGDEKVLEEKLDELLNTGKDDE
jgi:thiol-disulfide isomerase/thioredoxin